MDLSTTAETAANYAEIVTDISPGSQTECPCICQNDWSCHF